MPSLMPLMQLLLRIVAPEQYQSIDDEWRRLPNFELPADVNVSDPADFFWGKLYNYNGEDQVL